MSRDWAGLAFAAIPAGIGLALLGGRKRSLLRTGAAVATFAAAGWMVRASLRHIERMRAMRARYPAPGSFVHVRGQRIHVFAEGAGSPPLVLIPGGHTSAHSLHHLHRALRNYTRSILVDRPGTGWSGPARFPLSTESESHDIIAALDLAGERGPFVFAGHSFGGLLAANIARRYPERVAALVLLDPTPLDTVLYGPHLTNLSQMHVDAGISAFKALFGSYSKISAPDIERQVGAEVFQAVAALESAPRTRAANASIYRELSRSILPNLVWETMVYDGELGDLPVYVVYPNEVPEYDLLPAAAKVPDVQRHLDFLQRTRNRYLAASTRANRVVAPEGSGHNFPSTAPDFTIATLRAIIDETRTEESARR